MNLLVRAKNNYFKHAAYRRVFESDDGKFILADMIRKYYVLRPTYVVGDPKQSDLNEGMRKVVLDIINTLRIDPQNLIDKIEEADEYDV